MMEVLLFTQGGQFKIHWFLSSLLYESEGLQINIVDSKFNLNDSIQIQSNVYVSKYQQDNVIRQKLCNIPSTVCPSLLCMLHPSPFLPPPLYTVTQSYQYHHARQSFQGELQSEVSTTIQHYNTSCENKSYSGSGGRVLRCGRK